MLKSISFITSFQFIAQGEEFVYTVNDALRVYLILTIIIYLYYDIQAYVKWMASNMCITWVTLVCACFVRENKIIAHPLTSVALLSIFAIA